MITVRNILEQIEELEGYIKVQYWKEDEPIIVYEGKEVCKIKEEYKDRQISRMFLYDMGKGPALCIELKEIRIEITKEEAKELYCKGKSIFVNTNLRNQWKLPPSYAYSSHAPAEDLFYRSIPTGEGEVAFYKE